MSKVKKPKATPEKKPKVIQNPALAEIELQLNAKQEQFKLFQNQARNLKAEISQKQSQLEQIQHNILKTAASYNTLSSLKKTLSLQEGYKQQAIEPLLTSPTPKKKK